MLLYSCQSNNVVILDFVYLLIVMLTGYIHRSGNVYKGEWHCNERHGGGTMHWYDRGERYTGQWVKGVQHGQGEHMWIIQGSDNAQVGHY